MGRGTFTGGRQVDAWSVGRHERATNRDGFAHDVEVLAATRAAHVLNTRGGLKVNEDKHIDVVRRYFDACNSGVLEDFKPTLADDVVHYFLPARFAPIRGPVHLARFWRRFKQLSDTTWGQSTRRSPKETASVANGVSFGLRREAARA